MVHTDNYESFVFRLTNNSLELNQQELEQPIVRSDGTPIRAGRRPEWDDATIAILLRCIIENGFYLGYASLNKNAKTKVWKDFHQYFCQQPEIIAYAASARGKKFRNKHREVKYIQDKFLDLKKRYRKAIISNMDSGDSPEPDKYPHFDDMKRIMTNDGSLHRSTAVERPIIEDSVIISEQNIQNQREENVSNNTERLSPINNSLLTETRSPEETHSENAIPTHIPGTPERTEQESFLDLQRKYYEATIQHMNYMQSAMQAFDKRFQEFMAKMREQHRLNRLANEREAELDRKMYNDITQKLFNLVQKSSVAKNAAPVPTPSSTAVITENVHDIADDE